jgi:glutaredoxin
MKKIFLLVIVGLAGYQIWGQYSYLLSKPEPLYDQAYVVVYGRDSCGFTQQTLKQLKRSGIPFEYENVDDQTVADLLHDRMEKSGISTRRYNLPVVDVNNHLSIRPDSREVVQEYRASSF